MRDSSSVAELADFTRYSFRAAGQNNRRYLLALIASNTLGSNNVDVSPSSRPSATSRSSRRMILPLRVFGSSGTTWISRGRAIGEISRATSARSSSIICSRGVSAWWAIRMTNATIACPVVSSVAPTTAASATPEWPTSADSTSAVEIRCPDTFITSSTRPSNQMAPSRS